MGGPRGPRFSYSLPHPCWVWLLIHPTDCHGPGHTRALGQPKDDSRVNYWAVRETDTLPGWHGSLEVLYMPRGNMRGSKTAGHRAVPMTRQSRERNSLTVYVPRT